MLPTIAFKNGKVVMIDQRKLPWKEVYVKCSTYKEVAEAIKKMIIRGAPAIGIAAGYGIALGAKNIKAKNFKKFHDELNKILDVMAKTRPTAVNLFWAINEMKTKVINSKNKNINYLKKLLLDEAKKIEIDDIIANKKLEKFGADLIKKGTTVMTYCNAGSLATGGFGTAVGVIKEAHRQGKNIKAITCETRPFLQGARLTAWELKKAKVPFVLITDNMAGYFMKKGEIDVVVVGADRIAANGDFANKIGTYTAAVMAKTHNIPFYVAAPYSSIDLAMLSGEKIPIEERSSKEVTHILGKRITPDKIAVKNPAFDVTEHRYVTAIITEKGVIYPPYINNLR